ncbi:MAG: homocysteine S-methyltransferase family protein [Bacillota bacterium]|nr:homocysteine S-methyltransferase family protein [Bacillota bacterium]
MSRVLILDGAMGTMFQRNGIKPGEDTTQFAYENPDIVEKIQRMYVEAGSDALYAPTFNLNREKIAKMGASLEEIVAGLMAPTIKVRDEAAAQGRAVIAGLDMGPQGQLLEPMGTKTFEEAYDFFAELVRAGEAAGADFVVIETMTDLYETKAALLAAKENSQMPVIVSMSFEENGRTFTGTSLKAFAVTAEGLGADAIGINCSLGPVQILPMIKELMSYTDLPVFAKPNAGLPDPQTGTYDIDCGQFVAEMKKFMEAGVSMVGGCCGTDPEYIRGLAEIRNEIGEIEAPDSADPAKGLLTVCSGSKAVTVDHVTVIGERLNPTGKKKLKQALLDGDYDYVALKVLEQTEAGAEILDVNVGVPGLDEAAAIGPLIKKLQSVTNVPLQIDSANPQVIEAGLRVYNGKAIVNSINGEAEALDSILPIVKKYGAAVIGLTLDDTGIPETAEQRFRIAERIIKKAEEYGIPRRDIIIDCLTLTVSAQQKEVNETLKTVRMIDEVFGLNTALGVSNVSFGLPIRPVVNRTFLTMALENGLTMPIINPNDEDMMAAIYAFNVLKNKDENAVQFIERFGDSQLSKLSRSSGAAKAPAAASASEGSVEERLLYHVLNGLERETAEEVRGLLADHDGIAIVNDYLIPALDKVGKGFEKGEIFLPQMMQAAQAAQAGFDVIKKNLLDTGQTEESKGEVVIATVRGDIHDIGKNIVKVIMENYGFKMIDLGRDVPKEKVIETVKEKDIKLVGLSALMTTTLSSMGDTIKMLREEAPDCKVMVGGAVLTEDYAAEMGADFYCSDAMRSVQAARDVFDSNDDQKTRIEK